MPTFAPTRLVHLTRAYKVCASLAKRLNLESGCTDQVDHLMVRLAVGISLIYNDFSELVASPPQATSILALL